MYIAINQLPKAMECLTNDDGKKTSQLFYDHVGNIRNFFMFLKKNGRRMYKEAVHHKINVRLTPAPVEK